MALSRAGIELPLSFIIILLVSMIVLGLGGAFTYRLVCSAEERITAVDQQQERELERRLLTGPAVIIPDATKKAQQPSGICGSDPVQGAVYTLGIRNDFDVDVEYTITCDYKGIDATGSGGGNCNLLQFRTPVTIAPRERDVLLVAADVTNAMLPGRHVYTLEVTATPPSPATAFNRKVNFYLDVE